MCSVVSFMFGRACTTQQRRAHESISIAVVRIAGKIVAVHCSGLCRKLVCLAPTVVTMAGGEAVPLCAPLARPTFSFSGAGLAVGGDSQVGQAGGSEFAYAAALSAAGCPASVAKDSPLGLLYTAAHHYCVELLAPPPKRGRCNEKTNVLAVNLRRLQAELSQHSGFVPPWPRDQRVGVAWQAYREWYDSHKRTNKGAATAEMTQAEFASESDAVISNWLLLAEVGTAVCESRAPGRMPQHRSDKEAVRHPAPQFVAGSSFNGTAPAVKAPGIFVSWCLGVQENTGQLRSSRVGGGEMRTFHAIEYQCYVQLRELLASANSYVSELGAKICAGSWVMALESEQGPGSSPPWHVNLHWLVCALSLGGGSPETEAGCLTVSPADLVFLGKEPQHLSLMRGSRRCDLIAGIGAMYYLLCDKRGGLVPNGPHTSCEDVMPCAFIPAVSRALPCRFGQRTCNLSAASE